MTSILTVADAVTTAISVGLTAGDDTDVTRTYLPEVTDPEVAEGITTRKVYVVPTREGQVAQVRGRETNEYGFGVLVVCRYRGDEASPPAAWIDAEIAWVETYVYARLQDPRTANVAAAITAADLWCESAAVESVYDPELLRGHKLFWSESSFAFRKAETV
jgi:hypothetical protein